MLVLPIQLAVDVHNTGRVCLKWISSQNLPAHLTAVTHGIIIFPLWPICVNTVGYPAEDDASFHNLLK